MYSYSLPPNIILQNALSTELISMISLFEADRKEIDEIYKEYTEIAEKELFLNTDMSINTYYCNKLEELQEIFLSKRQELMKRFEILRVINRNPIFLN